MGLNRARRYLLRSARYQLPRRGLQPLYERIHMWTLYGMNIGGATRPFRASGERAVLRRLAASWPAGQTFTCVDVGANVGDYTDLVLGLFDHVRVVAVEPASSTYDLLSNRFASNSRVDCARVALGRESSVASLWRAARWHECASLLPPDAETERESIREQVTVTTLDTLCASLSVSGIDLLKVDVEGTELDVLIGAERLLSAGRLARVQFEFGEQSFAAGTRLLDFYKLLGDGYDFYRLTRTGPYPLGPYRPALEITVSASNYLAVQGGPT